MEFLFVIGAFQSCFFAALLLTRKQNHRANRFMGIWLIFLGMFFFEAWVVASGTYLKIPHLSGLFSGTPLVHGPFLLLYAVFLIRPKQKFRPVWLLHLLPFVIYYIHGGLTFFGMPAPEKLTLMADLIAGNPPDYLFAWGAFKSFHGLAYVIATLLVLRAHRHRMQDQFSNLERVNLKWLSYLTWGLMGIYLFATANVGLVLIFEINLEAFLGLLTAVLILGMAFMAMRQAELFGASNGIGSLAAVVVGAEDGGLFGLRGVEGNAEEGSRTIGKPSRNSENGQDFPTGNVELVKKIRTYLTSEKPYLITDLSLGQMAEDLEIPYKDLSRTMNEDMGMNFFTLINHYRIEEFKRELQDPNNNNLTLLGLAYKCGFNSKTTFNTVFKKVTGQTPSQYKQSL